MHIEVLEDNVDVKAFLKEANSVKVKLGLGWNQVKQIGIQGHKPDLDPLEEWKSSIGRGTGIQYPETYFKYPLFDIPLINRFIEKYGLVRTRIMGMQEKSCYTAHNDLSKRIHIPLISNPDCFIMVEDRVYHLEPGKVYLVNTTLKHTAINASKNFRLHLVGSFYDHVIHSSNYGLPS